MKASSEFGTTLGLLSRPMETQLIPWNRLCVWITPFNAAMSGGRGMAMVTAGTPGRIVTMLPPTCMRASFT